MLPAPAGAQPLETIPRGDREFEGIPHAIHLIELPPGDRPQVARARRRAAAVSTPSKMSPVPRSRNDRITVYIMAGPDIALEYYG